MSVEAVYIFFPAVLVVLAVAGSFFSTRLELRAEQRKAKEYPKVASPRTVVPAPVAPTVIAKPVPVFAGDPLQPGSYAYGSLDSDVTEFTKVPKTKADPAPDDRARQLAALILKSGQVVMAGAEPTVENSTALEKFRSYYSKSLQVQTVGKRSLAKRDYRILRPKRKIWIRRSK